jgi:hypothetical protein
VLCISPGHITRPGLCDCPCSEIVRINMCESLPYSSIIWFGGRVKMTSSTSTAAFE